MSELKNKTKRQTFDKERALMIHLDKNERQGCNQGECIGGLGPPIFSRYKKDLACKL